MSQRIIVRASLRLLEQPHGAVYLDSRRNRKGQIGDSRRAKEKANYSVVGISVERVVE